MTQLNDLELLEAYARERSEEAFRELVERYIDFVYSAALRRLGNPHLAEEATQSAFIALAEKATRLRPGTLLAGWLHQAVNFAALKLQRSEARRKHWESVAGTVCVSDDPDPPLEAPALAQIDGALAELSEPDRNAILLRFLQQKGLRDVAQAMGTSEEAAKKRVSRALERLRGLLARRGVVIPLAALAAGLAQLPVTAAPARLPAELAARAMDVAVPAGVWLFASNTARMVAMAVLLLGGFSFFVWPRRADRVSAASTNLPQTPMIKVAVTSVMVNDQNRALQFYTNVLGFVAKTDLDLGGERWLTVVSPAEPDGPELLLEPMGFAPARTYQASLFQAGIPLTTFAVDDLERKYQVMSERGVIFSQKPTRTGPVTVAVFEDTCGNRIQLVQPPVDGTSGMPLAPRIRLTSVLVTDQAAALAFYTEVLGFVKKQDKAIGDNRWLTVVAPGEPDGVEVLLEPMGFAPARAYQKALFEAGIPFTSFAVPDAEHAHERLRRLGVRFTMAPTRAGPVTMAVLDDTCGNLLQLVSKATQ